MADKLVVREDGGVFRLQWLLEDQDDYGSTLGEGDDLAFIEKPSPAERGDWEHWTAVRTAADTKPERDSAGFWWETRKAAEGVLRVIREALKQERPMPEWAKTALAHGWKPPKGWKA